MIGALYYRTSGTPQLFIWNGTAWDAAAFSSSGAVTSFNGREGAVTLSSSDVTTALTYTPYNASNPSNYLTSSTAASTYVSNTSLANTLDAYLLSNNAVATYAPISTTVTLTGAQTVTNKTINGSNNTITNISLTSGVTGTLPIANGGTNATTADGALTALGGTTVGTGVFKAVDAAAARTSIGAGTGNGDVTLTGIQTLTNKTLTDPAIIGTILEDIFTITDGAAFEIDPSNGSIQLITLGASRTPKATNFANGESVTLMVDDGSAYTLTWTDSTFGGTGVVWKTNAGAAPTLNTTGYTVIVLWEVGGQVYGARVGDA